MSVPKIRILHSTYSIGGGGAERQLVNLLNTIDTDSFENAVCCLKSQGQYPINQPVNIFEIPRAYKYDFRWRNCAKIFKEWKPDIVHNWSIFVLPTDLPLSKFFGRIVYIASYRVVHRLDDFLNVMYAFALPFVDKVVSNVHEEAMATPFRQLFRWKAGELIYNGIDIDAIQSAERMDLANYDIDPLLPKVLFVGRLVKRKNLPLLIDTIKILERERAFPCQLVICGDGDEKPALMELARQMDVFHRIKFIGFRPDVFRFMKSCDVFVLPSIMEGMPNALFEAMVARVPVIVSDIPEHRKWIEDGQNGYLFDPKDARELADKIHLSILDRDQSKENLMGKAYDLASKFTIERMAHCYEDLYKRMASELNR